MPYPDPFINPDSGQQAGPQLPSGVSFADDEEQSPFFRFKTAFQNQFGRPLEVTGDMVNNPMHRTAAKQDAFDVRVKDLKSEHLSWMDNNLNKFGLAATKSDGTESWSSGPHWHLQPTGQQGAIGQQEAQPIGVLPEGVSFADDESDTPDGARASGLLQDLGGQRLLQQQTGEDQPVTLKSVPAEQPLSQPVDFTVGPQPPAKPMPIGRPLTEQEGAGPDAFKSQVYQADLGDLVDIGPDGKAKLKAGVTEQQFLQGLYGSATSAAGFTPEAAQRFMQEQGQSPVGRFFQGTDPRNTSLGIQKILEGIKKGPTGRPSFGFVIPPAIKAQYSRYTAPAEEEQKANLERDIAAERASWADKAARAAIPMMPGLSSATPLLPEELARNLSQEQEAFLKGVSLGYVDPVLAGQAEGEKYTTQGAKYGAMAGSVAPVVVAGLLGGPMAIALTAAGMPLMERQPDETSYGFERRLRGSLESEVKFALMEAGGLLTGASGGLASMAILGPMIRAATSGIGFAGAEPLLHGRMPNAKDLDQFITGAIMSLAHSIAEARGEQLKQRHVMEAKQQLFQLPPAPPEVVTEFMRGKAATQQPVGPFAAGPEGQVAQQPAQSYTRPNLDAVGNVPETRIPADLQVQPGAQPEAVTPKPIEAARIVRHRDTGLPLLAVREEGNGWVVKNPRTGNTYPLAKTLVEEPAGRVYLKGSGEPLDVRGQTPEGKLQVWREDGKLEDIDPAWAVREKPEWRRDIPTPYSTQEKAMAAAKRFTDSHPDTTTDVQPATSGKGYHWFWKEGAPEVYKGDRTEEHLTEPVPEGQAARIVGNDMRNSYASSFQGKDYTLGPSDVFLVRWSTADEGAKPGDYWYAGRSLDDLVDSVGYYSHEKDGYIHIAKRAATDLDWTPDYEGGEYSRIGVKPSEILDTVKIKRFTILPEESLEAKLPEGVTFADEVSASILPPAGRPTSNLEAEAQAGTTPPSERLPQEMVQEPARGAVENVITDTQGQPKQFYHSTTAPEEFSSFNTTNSELGAHFGTRQQASSMAGRTRTIPVHLSIKNPLRLVDHGDFEGSGLTGELVDRGILDERQYEKAVELEGRPELTPFLQAAIEAHGYDGVVYLNRREGVSGEDIANYDDLTDADFQRQFPNAKDSYIAFRPEQIKAKASPLTTTRSPQQVGEALRRKYGQESTGVVYDRRTGKPLEVLADAPPQGLHVRNPETGRDYAIHRNAVDDIPAEQMPDIHREMERAGLDARQRHEAFKSMGIEFKDPVQMAGTVRGVDAATEKQPSAVLKYRVGKFNENYIVVGRFPGGEKLMVLTSDAQTKIIQSPFGETGNSRVRGGVDRLALSKVPEIDWPDVGLLSDVHPTAADVRRVNPNARTLSDLSDVELQKHFPQSWKNIQDAEGYIGEKAAKEAVGQGMEGQERILPEEPNAQAEEPETVRKSRERLRQNLTGNTLSMNPVQSFYDTAVTVGWDVYKAAKSGAANFEDWSRDMVKRLGDNVKPHLEAAWDALTKPAPVWFSPLERQIKLKMSNKMPALELRKMLDKAGLSRDELEWTSTNEFLKQKANAGEPVTKKEMLEHLAKPENQIQIKDVWHGEESGVKWEQINSKEAEDYIARNPDLQANWPRWVGKPEPIRKATSPDGRTLYVVPSTTGTAAPYVIMDRLPLTELPEGYRLQNDRGFWSLIKEGADSRFDDTKERFHSGDPDEALKEALARLDAAHEVGTARNIEQATGIAERRLGAQKEVRYAQYTSPGGKNQRELLLTLPERKLAKPTGFEEWRKTPEGREYTNEGEAAMAYERSVAGRAEPDMGPAYRSPHWDEPNVLAHIRMNDRDIPIESIREQYPDLYERLKSEGRDTARGLHVEEIQSDLHQASRKMGIRLDPKKADLVATEKDGYFEVTNRDDGRFVTNVNKTYPGDERGENEVDTPEDAILLARKRLEARSHSAVDKGVPAMPLQKNWQDASFKRMLREASEKGYDLMTWSTGAEQFKRWGSPRVDWARDRLQVSQQFKPSLETGEAQPTGWMITTETGQDIYDSFPSKQAAERYITNHPRWKLATKEQQGGNAGGINIEGEALRRNILKANNETVETKADLRQNLEEVMNREEDEYSPENWKKHIDAMTDKVWGRMQVEDVGTHMPRKEGMEGFYDKMIPDFARSYGKKFGAKIGTVDIGPAINDDLKRAFGDDLSKLPEHLAQSPMHSIDISSKMRDSVIRAGQSLFGIQEGEPSAVTDSLVRLQEQMTAKKRNPPKASIQQINPKAESLVDLKSEELQANFPEALEQVSRTKQALGDKAGAEAIRHASTEILPEEQDRLPAGVRIEPLKESDISEAIKVGARSFPGHSEEFESLIRDGLNDDFSQSYVAKNADGEIMGGYFLKRQPLPNILEARDYRGRRGIEGVALFVPPEYRGSGIGKALRGIPPGLPDVDYVWGQHFEDLGNIDNWTRFGRKYLGTFGGVRLTVDDLSQREPEFVSKSRDRLRQHLNGGTLSINPIHTLYDTAIVTGWDVYKGAKEFKEWAKQMVERLGDRAKPYLDEVWAKMNGQAPQWFSPLENTIKLKMPNKASADQVKGILRGGGFILKDEGGMEVPNDEAHWTGLYDFLQRKSSAKEQVTKQEVLDHLAVNGIQLTERQFGGNPEYDTALQRLKQAGYDIEVNPESPQDIAFVERAAPPDERDFLISSELPEHLRRDAELVDDQHWRGEEAGRTPPKFTQHVTPGGTNEREFTLSLPTAADMITTRRGDLMRRWREAVQSGNKEEQVQITKKMNEEVAVQRDRPIYNVPGSHAYGIPEADINRIAIIRTNNRVGPNGEKILHVDEYQDDLQNQIQGLKKKITNYEEQKKDYLKGGQSRAIPGWREDTYEAEIKASQEEIKRLESLLPFRGKSHELAFKRVLDFGIKNGYDKISWATGQQVADRYHLSKHIDSLEIDKNDNGTYTISGHPVNGRRESQMFEDQVPEAKLSDYIGKELAQRASTDLASGRKAEYDGLDLKVGGEGKKTLYDNLIPIFLSKYTKRWGGKVGTADINTPPDAVSGEDIMRKMGIPQDRQDAYWRDLSMDQMDALFKHYREENAISPVHSLNITSEMKDAINRTGQPLFGTSEGEPPAIVDARARLAESMSGRKLNMNPFQDMWDMSLVEGYKTYKLAKKFGGWSNQMVKKLGEVVRPILKRTWAQVKLMMDINTPGQEGFIGQRGPDERLAVATRKKYGTTRNPAEAGFIASDGSLIDSQGDDHYDIVAKMLNKKVASLSDEALPEFLSRTHFIRVSHFEDAKGNFFSALGTATPLTDSQMQSIAQRYGVERINTFEVYDMDGNAIFSKSFPSGTSRLELMRALRDGSDIARRSLSQGGFIRNPFSSSRRIPAEKVEKEGRDAWDEFIEETETMPGSGARLPRQEEDVRHEGQVGFGPFDEDGNLIPREPQRQTFSRTLDAYMKANQLFSLSPWTHKVGSLAGNAVTGEVVKPIAAGIDAIRSAATKQSRELLWDPVGIGQAAAKTFSKDTARDVKDIIRRGYTEEQLERYGLPNEITGRNPVMAALSDYTFRVFKAGVHPFQTYAFWRSMHEQAKLLAMGEQRAGLLRDSNLEDRTMQIMRGEGIGEGSHATMEGNALLGAADTTFQADNPIYNKIKELKQGNEAWYFAANRLIPFAKAPSNAILKALEMSPGIGVTYRTLEMANNWMNFDKPFPDKSDLRKFETAWAQLPVGVGLFALGAALHKHGMMTSLGYKSGLKDENDERKTKVPGALVMGGHQIDIARYSPIGLIMAMGATYDEKRGMSEQTGNSWAHDLFTSMVNWDILDKIPLLSQVGMIGRWRETGSIPGSLKSTPLSLIPGYATGRDILKGRKDESGPVAGYAKEVLHIKGSPPGGAELRLLDKVRKKYGEPLSEETKDRVDAEAAVAKAARHGKYEEAQKLYEKYVKDGVIPPGKDGEPEKATVSRIMDKAKLTPLQYLVKHNRDIDLEGALDAFLDHDATDEERRQLAPIVLQKEESFGKAAEAGKLTKAKLERVKAKIDKAKSLGIWDMSLKKAS